MDGQMDGWKLYRKIGQKGKEWVALYVREQQERRELRLGVCQEPAETLWVWFSGQANMGAVVVSICCRPPDQEELDEAFFKQLEEASCSQTLVVSLKGSSAIVLVLIFCLHLKKTPTIPP